MSSIIVGPRPSPDELAEAYRIAVALLPDRLYFFSKSANAPVGSGVHEFVASPAEYEGLSRVSNWRRRLSNFHYGRPFQWQGRTFNTIEHAFQWAKIRRADAGLADRTFTVEHGGVVGNSKDGVAARQARKVAILNVAQLREWDRSSAATMEEIARAKYAADPEAATVLLLTRKAQLWHGAGRGATATRFAHLERIRDELATVLAGSDAVARFIGSA